MSIRVRGTDAPVGEIAPATSAPALPAWAKGWRVVVLLTLAGLFLAGSFFGNDPAWPFGPWRMFSTSQAPTGNVIAMSIQVETSPAGPWVDAPIYPWTTGLNRAEVEGRIQDILARPSMLETLAVSHSRLKPHDPRWVGVRVVRVDTVIVDRVPTGQVLRKVLASWSPQGTTTVGPGN